MSNRRKVREEVLKALYAIEISGETAEEIIKKILNPAITDDAVGLRFAERLFLKTIDLSTQVDEDISEFLNNWDINRLALLDKLVLRMAIAEMITFEDVPAKVSINEAIEIAKKYSTAKSGKFVNGILDSVHQKLRQQNRIKKTGRGLIDNSVN